MQEMLVEFWVCEILQRKSSKEGLKIRGRVWECNEAQEEYGGKGAEMKNGKDRNQGNPPKHLCPSC